MLFSEIKSIFESPDIRRALARLSEVVDQYQTRYPKLAQKLSNEAEDCLSIFHFPISHRRRIRTTNTLERFNQEIKRRTRVVRIFPNPESAIRLISALAIEQSEEWTTGRMYLDMNEFNSEEYINENQEEGSKIVKVTF